ncbi:glycosyltransferase family 2 protein [Dendronalium sp. ChiSLP03b]|uniref:glycosyltransferase family 2 protein n=1 Tax=Dendronalium sp. ChiSLP03b TaxID=3075381 RepID=UPI002AD273B2|nr:glycosyltransferase family 2 protein [Dendronalium sp. ChiSLP03b]MDZ8205637.1 glycosyltransferase family 2 protein [Dendronalium sp. ChiSLP03b]
MKFSVVITTYNRLNLLRRAIDSALNQTIPCEVVIADDCSSKETETYVKSLGDSVVYHRNEINRGHAATVNAGVQKAKGDWIKFLDDDDYLAPNCIEQMAEAIALCPDAVMCSCVAAQVDVNEVELSRTPQLGPGLAFYIPQADIHYGMLLELVPFGTPVQVACHREAFWKTGGWDSQLDANCDDIDSWIRIAQFGHAIFINQCLAYRTIWPGAYNQKFSLSRRLDTNILMKEKIYTLIDGQHRSHVPALEDIKNYLKLHWTLVALKQRNLQNFVKMLDKSLFSLFAWWLLLTAICSRRSQIYNPHIHKFVLIETQLDMGAIASADLKNC